MQDTLQRAWQLYRFQRYSLALREVTTFLAVEPESSDAHSLKALIHGKLEQTEAAILAGRQAVTLNPADSRCLYIYAIVNSWFNNDLEALGAIENALKLNPLDVDYLELSALLFLKLGKTDIALRQLHEGLSV